MSKKKSKVLNTEENEMQVQVVGSSTPYDPHAVYAPPGAITQPTEAVEEVPETDPEVIVDDEAAVEEAVVEADVKEAPAEEVKPEPDAVKPKAALPQWLTDARKSKPAKAPAKTQPKAVKKPSAQSGKPKQKINYGSPW